MSKYVVKVDRLKEWEKVKREKREEKLRGGRKKKQMPKFRPVIIVFEAKTNYAV